MDWDRPNVLLRGLPLLIRCKPLWTTKTGPCQTIECRSLYVSQLWAGGILGLFHACGRPSSRVSNSICSKTFRITSCFCTLDTVGSSQANFRYKGFLLQGMVYVLPKHLLFSSLLSSLFFSLSSFFPLCCNTLPKHMLFRSLPIHC